MIKFRQAEATRLELDLRVHTNPDGIARNINPFDHGSKVHTDVMKTQALRQALDAGRYDAVIGGARRDEEASRSKERIFSFRDRHHGWDPKRQRPELWRVFNGRVGPGESMRTFPLSNWPELDVWRYIQCEGILMVPGQLPAEGALASDAQTLDAVSAELRASRFSEQQVRLIAKDEAGSIE